MVPIITMFISFVIIVTIINTSMICGILIIKKSLTSLKENKIDKGYKVLDRSNIPQKQHDKESRSGMTLKLNN